MTENDKVNVLLVDDSPVNLLVLRSTLDGLNINMVEAQSGQEALNHLQEMDFAVILLDVMMPGMDGFETARRIRELERTLYTPIIFVTAMYRNETDAFRGYLSGAVDYITKPFVPEVLRSKVGIFVDLFRKTEQVKRQAEHIRTIEQREYMAKLHALEEQMQRETERERAETRAVRAVLKHAPVAFARLDNQNKVIESNPLFAEHFRLDLDAVGKPHEIALTGLPEAIQDAIDLRRPYLVHGLKLYEDTGTGSNRYCDIAVWPVNGGDGQFNGTILTSTDVTQRVLLDEQRRDFVATLAHDLQTPVIASDRALSLLVGKIEGSVSQDLVDFVGMLRKNNQNLLHMIEGLLDVYHYEEGASSLYFDAIDLNLLIASCVDELMPLAQTQRLTINTDLTDDLPPVFADRTAIRRVLTNLLDNAIKFTPGGGTISLSSRRQDNQVIISVTDSGIGVTADDMPHLFQRYWHGRGHTSHKSSRGLGLFLCRQIINSHYGSIECQSTPGQSTTFTCTLPALDAKTAMIARSLSGAGDNIKS